MELMTGAEMFDGFERRLPIKKLDDATKSTAMERFGTYEKKGVIKGCSFEDDVWMLTDELRLVQFDFRFSHTAYEKNAREWVGCTASCFGDYMKSYVLLQLGTIGLLRLQQIIGEIKKAAVCDSENVGAEMDDKETQHLARFLSLIPDSNELRDSVIEELEARTVKLGNTKARDLSGFKNYLEFDRRMKDFWKIADEDDKMFYFPVFFWWNLTNILPLRATEFLMTPYDCITEENGKTFIRIRRTTRKKGIRRRGYKVREDFEIFTYEIPGWMYAEIEGYKKRTEIVSRPLLDTLLVSMGPTPRGYFTYGQMKLRLSRFCRDIMGDEEYPINLGDTRHLAMINLILSGGSPVICRELAGHEDINISSNYYANLSGVVESIVYEKFHGHTNRSGLTGDRKYYLSLPEDRLRVTDGWCTSKRMLAGDVGDCVGCYHPGGSIGECRQCRYFYADRKGLQIKLQKEAKEAVNADGIYLMQMIELVRKSLGYKEDIDSAILRLRGSADHYGSLLSRKYREER